MNLSLQDLSILLVEPSLAQCRIIVDHLNQVGLNKIEVAESGAAALADMRAHTPDLVISAMYFDDMTGSDLVQKMRQSDELADVPFMLISSERHAQHLEPIRQAGVLAILPKPFKVEDLKRALQASLDFIAPEELELDGLEADDLRVLVVDDSRFAQRNIVTMLQRLGVDKITTAQNGREAAELVRDQVFDLVLTDYNMPEMDGEELINYIRHISNQPELPVLMVTSETDQARLAAVRQAGVSALCDKPFDINTLRAMTRTLLSET